MQGDTEGVWGEAVCGVSGEGVMGEGEMGENAGIASPLPEALLIPVLGAPSIQAANAAYA